MSDILSLSIVILAALIHALLQLGLGTLLLLYHASLGQHIKKKTRQLVSSYIAGIGYITLISLAATCFIVGFIFNAETALPIFTALTVALVIIGLLSWLIYFRISAGTELWIPQPIARFLNNRAKTTSVNTEAFALGLLTFIGELPFSLVLLVTAAVAILSLPFHGQLFAVALYTIIVLLPILTMRILIKKGKTVVEIQRWRVKQKKFFRIVLGSAFIILAMVILSFKILGN